MMTATDCVLFEGYGSEPNKLEVVKVNHVFGGWR